MLQHQSCPKAAPAAWSGRLFLYGRNVSISPCGSPCIPPLT